MSEYAAFIVIGLTTGSIYGLTAVGLVLTYKASGVFNFAQGALVSVAAFLFYTLYVNDNLPWPVCAAIVVLGAGTVMGLVLELLTRSIARATLVVQVSATVGILLATTAALGLIYGFNQDLNVPIFLGSSSVHFVTNIQWASIITFVFAVLATLGLAVYFRSARSGVEMRAVVDNPDLLGLTGANPTAVRRYSWIIGGTFAAASGVLLSPLLPLQPINLTFLVVAAFGAAAIGAFSRLPIVFGGGLLIGVLSSLATKFTNGWTAGLSASMPFLVLLAVLLVLPRRYLTGGVRRVRETQAMWSAPISVQLVGSLLVIGFLLAVPQFAGIHLTDWTTAIAVSVVFMSLRLLVKTSGQVSLCHVTFMAIGATAFSHLAVNHGIPWLAALILAGLVAVPIGALLAIPAIRLAALYLALATFGLGILAQYIFYSEGYMFGPSGLGLPMPRPTLSWIDVSSDRGYYYVVVIVVIISAVLLTALNRSRLGRLLRGLAESPTALQVSGTSINVTQVLVFCMAAFMAAAGGALIGVAESTTSAASYSPFLSLTYFVLIMIVPGREPWNALIAGVALMVIPSYISGGTVTAILQVVFGVSAVVYAMAPSSLREMHPKVRELIDKRFRHWEPSRRADSRDLASNRAVTPASQGRLQVEGLQVRFGGLIAVEDVNLVVPTGRIIGLIGPNGAGKTTTFDACSGLRTPNMGRIKIDGRDVTSKGPAIRARRGLGRTFQRMELFESLTVRENISIGLEGIYAGANPLKHVASAPGERIAVEEAAYRAAKLCGIAEFEDVPVAALSTGQRRLVELARCVAGPSHLMLLDEPSSGLDTAETEVFGDILLGVVAERGVGILLVEHDMPLSLRICDRIYVLDFGRVIFEGTPTEVVQSPIVQAAYLGTSSADLSGLAQSGA